MDLFSLATPSSKIRSDQVAHQISANVRNTQLTGDVLARFSLAGAGWGMGSCAERSLLRGGGEIAVLFEMLMVSVMDASREVRGIIFSVGGS